MEKSIDQKEQEVVLVEDEEDLVLPGFRFHPTDEELVGFYLRRKVDKKLLSIEIIRQIDIYKYSPWDLPKASTVGGEKEWYFFCLRGRKYRNSIRPNRVTGSGFWKATGIDRPIYSSTNIGECIGLKKSLVYYRGSAGKGTKTDWMMHEFRLPSSGKDNDTHPSIQEAEIWTICRIFKRNISFNKKYQQEWNGSNSKKRKLIECASTTSSFESVSVGDHYKLFGAPNNPHGEAPKLVYNNYTERDSESFQVQYSSVTSPVVTENHSLATVHNPNFANPASNEFMKDGNWDELGRIMEFWTDTNTAY
uniref:NAC domain-containing protein n=1 Tax=Ananas comosus var. bracteatus TaxID=296719 RepID=A0A6V7QF48_ANACO|nr:unnamed protein product [Ananas comosus var. bracteatus]